MGSLFASMNLTRWMILLSLLASCVLGYRVWERSGRLDEVHGELAKIEGVIKEIQTRALELNELQSVADKEGLKGESDPELYIRSVAQKDQVGIGQVDTSKRKSSPAKGIEDRIYKIKPSIKNRRYHRGAIANFLYKLEADSRRVKVTSVSIEPASKVKPGEIGPDEWTFEAEITSRQRTDE